MSNNSNKYQKIKQVIDSIKNEKWLQNKWWPNYLFHFTDISNAVKILTKEKFLSRSTLEKQGNFKDIASSEVINNTREKWKEYVRLYFRPKTPTQYRNEGIRPAGKIELGAHCPVPIYFLFDSISILTKEDIYFTNGNLAAKGCNPKNDIKDFENLPFEKIYHNKA